MRKNFNNFTITPDGFDVTPLREAIPVTIAPGFGAMAGDIYDDGYRDALESVLLALLSRSVSYEVIDAAITEALDAFTNNAE